MERILRRFVFKGEKTMLKIKDNVDLKELENDRDFQFWKAERNKER